VLQSLSGPGPLYYRGFTISLRHFTLGRTPLNEWYSRSRDFYLITHNHAPGRIQTRFPASQLPQIHALDRAATGVGKMTKIRIEK